MPFDGQLQELCRLSLPVLYYDLLLYERIGFGYGPHCHFNSLNS